MKLIAIGSNIFNLEAITHASYEENNVLDRLVNDDGTVAEPTEPGCTISFGCDDILILYGDEALQVWEMLQAKSQDLPARNKAMKAIAS